jgi:transcriptional regulator with XRE-family HTH domain
MTKLAEWMEKHGKTEKQVAEAVGISQPSISRIKNGQMKPSPKTAEALSRLTKIAAWEFVKPEAA